MPTYAIYYLSGKSFAKTERREFADDVEAIEYGRSQLRDLPIEIWDAQRHVGRLKPLNADPANAGNDWRYMKF